MEPLLQPPSAPSSRQPERPVPPIGSLLAELVAVPSVFPNEGRIAQVVRHHLESGGFRVRSQQIADGRMNLLADKGPAGAPTLMFMGHLDTVPPDDGYAQRHLPPFELRHDRVADVWRGLGVADMKAGVAALIAGLATVEPVKTRILVVLCADEENDSLGIHRFLAGSARDVGNLSLVVSADTGVGPFAERDELPPVRFLTGRMGRFPIEATIHGLSRHGADTQGGCLATTEAARFLLLLDRLQETITTPHPAFGRSAFGVSLLHAAARGFTSPSRCTVRLNWLSVPGETPEMVLDRLRAAIQAGYDAGELCSADRPIDLAVPPRETPYAMGFLTPTDSPAVAPAIRAYEEIIGAAPTPITGRSVADENFVAQALPGVPVVNLGPTGGAVHTVDEWLHPQAATAAAALFARLAERFDVAPPSG
jgi:succinyl-diaminopimelate desuccinylase